MTAHLPHRPAWTCLVCDHPWPCRTARLALTAEYEGMSSALAIYLYSQHCVAAVDIGDRVTAGDLYRRFLGWVGATS